MKLLLTSNGISNESIKNSLKKLVGEDEIKTAFIPTAGNSSGNNKSWLLRNLKEFDDLGFLDIVEISALTKEEWFPRLQKANVIVMGGGSTSYLIRKLKKSKITDELRNLLKERVYVGISAGSIVAGKKIWGASEYLFDKKYEEAPEGLGLIDLVFRSHYNSPNFPKLSKENLRKISKKNKIYAMDDNSAIEIIDNEIKIISEGEYEIFSDE